MNDSYCLLPISSHNYIEFSKNQTSIGRFAWSKNPTKEKLILSPAFNYSRKMSWDDSKKASKSILVKMKERQYQQLEILLFTMLKTLDSFLYWNSLLTKSQLWIRSLPTATKCKTYQLTIEDKFGSRSRSTILTNLTTFRFDCSPQKE